MALNCGDIDKAMPTEEHSSFYNGCFTPNLKLYMPHRTDYVRVSDLNYNFEIIDKNLGEGSKWRLNPEEWDPEKTYTKVIGKMPDGVTDATLQEDIIVSRTVASNEMTEGNVTIWKLIDNSPAVGTSPEDSNGAWKQLKWADAKNTLLPKSPKKDKKLPALQIRPGNFAAYSNVIPKATVPTVSNIGYESTDYFTGYQDGPAVDIMACNQSTSACYIRLFRAGNEPDPDKEELKIDHVGIIKLNSSQSLELGHRGYKSYTSNLDYQTKQEANTYSNAILLGMDKLVIAQNHALYEGMFDNYNPVTMLAFNTNDITMSSYGGPVNIEHRINGHKKIKPLDEVMNYLPEGYDLNTYLQGKYFYDDSNNIRIITQPELIPELDPAQASIDYDLFSEKLQSAISLRSDRNGHQALPITFDFPNKSTLEVNHEFGVNLDNRDQYVIETASIPGGIAYDRNTKLLTFTNVSVSTGDRIILYKIVPPLHTVAGYQREADGSWPSFIPADSNYQLWELGFSRDNVGNTLSTDPSITISYEYDEFYKLQFYHNGSLAYQLEVCAASEYPSPLTLQSNSRLTIESGTHNNGCAGDGTQLDTSIVLKAGVYSLVISPKFGISVCKTGENPITLVP